MSYREKLFLAGLIASAGFLGAAALWACGPFLPYWLITDEARILEAPTTWFKDALESVTLYRRRQVGPGNQFVLVRDEPRFRAVVDSEQGPYRQTAEIDLRELESAASDRNLTARYAAVRDALLQHVDAVAAWQDAAAWRGQAGPPPAAPELEVPAGLPGEFADYLRGAIAYHQGQLARARFAWEKLLERPAGERRLRSTWAAYMLGRANLLENPEAAVRWFERTRELAEKGFADSLGLAAASLGWQARAELQLQLPAEALKHYFQQMKTGDPTALSSLRRSAAKLLEDPKALEKIAGSDEARPIMTAYVISRWDRVDYDGPLDPAPAAKWLAAIRKANPQKVDDADRLAWIAYRAGDFTAAEEWLKRAPKGKPMTYWIQAKLLMRAGKLAEAQSTLGLAGSPLPKDPGPDHDPFQAYENQVQPALRPRAAGERGAIQLARGEYTEAFAALLDGGYWTDAAYVAERVLPIEQLRAYVDQAWPAKLAAHRPENYGDEWTILYGGIVTPDKERMAFMLRYLVGRRLVREGLHGDAEKYLPTVLRLALNNLARSLAEGRDARRPAEERSRALFRAACLTRYHGLELLGTELEPDWFVYEGQYETDAFAKARASGDFRQLGPTKQELEQAARSGATPAKRFHYRYRGADLARSAADLLPDGSIEKARILITAGNWLEGRDPEAARPFFDALLACCGETDLGRRARRVDAIPNVGDACPADTRVQGAEER